MGSEAERYLRVLQLTGSAALHPWTIRGLMSHEVSKILPQGTDHPWENSVDFQFDPPGGLDIGWASPRVSFHSNSSYPFGENDGGVWVGRGLTVLVEGGAFMRLGPLHLRVAPQGFWAENAWFDLAENGHLEEGANWDYRQPTEIDRPQRFGEKAYARLGLGSSMLQLALPQITLGVSGAGQQWGPALHYPLLLGNNAGGFAHVFGQTSTPVDLWAVRVHGRYIFGWPEQSDFSSTSTQDHHRIVTGIIVTLLPRGLPGLELGAARFMHTLSMGDGFGVRDIFRVFSGVTNSFMSGENIFLENQLASLFFRWAFPAAGIEIFGELIKDDFTRDLRHIIEEPDDMMGRVIGLQKVWSRDNGGLVVFRSEVVNSSVHHSERFDRLRRGGLPLPLYYNHGVRQGHTQLGQLLGSPTAYGGAGWTVGVDLYNNHGRWTADISRTLRTDFSAIHGGTNGPGINDVIYSLKMEAVRFREGVEWGITFSPSLNLNRNLIEKNDLFNMSIGLSVRGLPW